MPALISKTLPATLTAAVAAAILPTASLADTVSLDANLNFYTPEEDDIEYEDRINFNDGETGDQASLTRMETPGGDITEEFLIEGGDPSPGGVGGAVASGTIVAPWVASGSATARYDRLAVDAFWAGSRDQYGDAFDGSIRAEAEAWDEFEIAGDGELTFTYALSGSLYGIANGLDQWTELPDIADLQIDFIAEFDKEGSSQDAEVKFRREMPGGHDNFFYSDSFEDIFVDLTIGVLNGDVLDYKAWAQTFLEFDPEPGVTSTRGRTDFGSTAELVKVFATDGVSFTSASGFDYLSVNSTDTGSGDGPDDGNPLSPVPLPAGVWLLLGGLGLLWTSRRRA